MRFPFVKQCRHMLKMRNTDSEIESDGPTSSKKPKITHCVGRALRPLDLSWENISLLRIIQGLTATVANAGHASMHNENLASDALVTNQP